MTERSGDRIFVHGLAVDCIIGIVDWERRVRQTVVVDLEMSGDCRHASLTDEIADTLDYAKVAERAREFIGASEFKLVETLAHRLALVILAEFGVEWTRVSLSKPGAIPNSRAVGVVIERTRADLPR
ncbi:MAG TPA: dihydroneopterin aldolase [Steroidobacteraceae bacterium]|nr:dihydroneopterin aldolase [Steroidobacteraceae bacterium]